MCCPRRLSKFGEAVVKLSFVSTAKNELGQCCKRFRSTALTQRARQTYKWPRSSFTIHGTTPEDWATSKKKKTRNRSSLAGNEWCLLLPVIGPRLMMAVRSLNSAVNRPFTRPPPPSLVKQIDNTFSLTGQRLLHLGTKFTRKVQNLV